MDILSLKIVFSPLLSLMVTLAVSVIKVISGSVVVIATLKNSSVSIALSSLSGILPQALEVLSSKVSAADVAEKSF